MVENKKIVFYDGICNLCNRSVKIILKYERKKELHFASLDSEIFKKMINVGSIYEGKKTILFLDNKKIYTKSNAIIQISNYLKFPFNMLTIMRWIPVEIRDKLYDYISKNRYRWFGKSDNCSFPVINDHVRFLP